MDLQQHHHLQHEIKVVQPPIALDTEKAKSFMANLKQIGLPPSRRLELLTKYATKKFSSCFDDAAFLWDIVASARKRLREIAGEMLTAEQACIQELQWEQRLIKNRFRAASTLLYLELGDICKF